jgi:hypothetical protein
MPSIDSTLNLIEFTEVRASNRDFPTLRLYEDPVELSKSLPPATHWSLAKSGFG